MGKITDALTRIENERRKLPPKREGRPLRPVFLWGGLFLLVGLALLCTVGGVLRRASSVPPAPIALVQAPQVESPVIKRVPTGEREIPMGEPVLGTTIYANVEIAGDSRFVDEVKAALALLEKKSGRSFSLVKRQIGKIERSEEDFRDLDRTPAVLGLSDQTVFRSTTWLAGAIAESACHAKEYHRTWSFPGFSDPDPDKACSDYRLGVMRRIGAPQDELQTGYTVQVYSFFASEPAERAVSDLRGKGYEAFLVKGPNAIAVCVGNFETVAKAETRIPDLRVIAPDAFVRNR